MELNESNLNQMGVYLSQTLAPQTEIRYFLDKCDSPYILYDVFLIRLFPADKNSKIDLSDSFYSLLILF